jgi:hypothetical protein
MYGLNKQSLDNFDKKARTELGCTVHVSVGYLKDFKDFKGGLSPWSL